MKIQVTKIRDWFAPSLDLRTAWDIVTREYCLPLTRVNVCPRNCDLCKPHLEKMFDLSAARSPAALLTYLARRERALAADQARDHEAPDLHIDVSDIVLSRGKEGNPFEEFLSTL